MNEEHKYYKYRSLNNFEFLLDILLNERLYATSYLNMNDPMEGVYYSRGLSSKELREIRVGKENNKICSLSACKNDLLMWSHYADGARGINIGFQVIEPNLQIEPIRYADVPEINELVGRAEDVAKKILCYKHPCWSYEQEYRVFTNKNYVKIKIKEIILGQRIKKEHATLIKSLVERLLPHVKVRNYKDAFPEKN